MTSALTILKEGRYDPALEQASGDLATISALYHGSRVNLIPTTEGGYKRRKTILPRIQSPKLRYLSEGRLEESQKAPLVHVGRVDKPLFEFSTARARSAGRTARGRAARAREMFESARAPGLSQEERVVREAAGLTELAPSTQTLGYKTQRKLDKARSVAEKAVEKARKQDEAMRAPV